MGATAFAVSAWIWQYGQIQEYFAKSELSEAAQTKALADLQLDVNYLIRTQTPQLPNRVAARPGALQDEAEQ